MNEGLPILSIIVPVLNEEGALPGCLGALAQGGRFLPAHEVMVVDGGSRDQTCEVARQFGAKVVLASKRGRAFQMNEGALTARGEWLFFVHADSTVTEGACRKLRRVIEEKRWAGGCFSQKIDHTNLIYAYLAWTGNVRAKLKKIFYGDQAIFVRKEIFEKIGGYPPIPILEDVVFSQKLRQAGEVSIQKEKVVSSPRRWEKMGLVATTLLYAKVRRGFARGIAPEKLKEIYLDVR